MSNLAIDASRCHNDVSQIGQNVLIGALVSGLAIGVLALSITGIYSGATHSNFVHILSRSQRPILLVGFIGSILGGMIYAGRKGKLF